MTDAVLIVAPSDDIHASALAVVLEKEFDTPALIWDSGSFPTHAQIDFALDRDGIALRFKGLPGDLSLDDLRSIWWRRPTSPRLDQGITDPKVRTFCSLECDALFKGALNAADVLIINHPLAQAAAAYKPLQLAEARKLQLAIPATLMSNNPDHIREFWERYKGRCIYKPFTAPSWAFSETRPLTREDLPYLDKLRHAPIIVQEKIEKGLDVRVNIFGRKIFAAAVTTHVRDADLDWRLDQTAQWHEHDLPQSVGLQLRSLLDRLGLEYGCIDLRQEPDGTYRFLEVNPAGQFLFVEVDTGQPLLQSLAALLACPNAPKQQEKYGNKLNSA